MRPLRYPPDSVLRMRASPAGSSQAYAAECKAESACVGLSLCSPTVDSVSARSAALNRCRAPLEAADCLPGDACSPGCVPGSPHHRWEPEDRVDQLFQSLRVKLPTRSSQLIARISSLADQLRIPALRQLRLLRRSLVQYMRARREWGSAVRSDGGRLRVRRRPHQLQLGNVPAIAASSATSPTYARTSSSDIKFSHAYFSERLCGRRSLLLLISIATVLQRARARPRSRSKPYAYGQRDGRQPARSAGCAISCTAAWRAGQI